MKNNFERLGFRQEPLDSRDVKFEQVKEIFATSQYPEVYFVPELVKVIENKVNMQYNQPSCIAEAGDRIKESQELKETGIFIDFSPQFTYSVCKKLDGWDGQGTDLRTLMKVMQKIGGCPELIYPSNYQLPISEFKDWNRIPEYAYKEAEKYRIKDYFKVDKNFEDFKRGIFEAKGLIGGFSGNNAGWRKSPIEAPNNSNEVAWGHGVTLIGYEKNYIWLVNSWSDSWGAELRLKKINDSIFGEFYVPSSDGEAVVKGVNKVDKYYIESLYCYNAWGTYDLRNNWSEQINMPLIVKKENNSGLYQVGQNKILYHIKNWDDYQKLYKKEDISEISVAEFEKYKISKEQIIVD